MNRREWFKKAAILATGAVAANQLELLDRLGWKRTLFPSAAIPTLHEFKLGFYVSREMIEDSEFYARIMRPGSIIFASPMDEFEFLEVKNG
jgi:hypothetical protein